jgi:hypothetical protein
VEDDISEGHRFVRGTSGPGLMPDRKWGIGCVVGADLQNRVSASEVLALRIRQSGGQSAT